MVAAFDHDATKTYQHDGIRIRRTRTASPMRGPSAYGGPYRLAALKAAIDIGEHVGDEATVSAR